MSRRQRYVVATAGTLTALLVLGFLVFLWRPALLVGVSAENLGHSVASEFRGSASGICVELDAGRWRCQIDYEADPGSGGRASARYLVSSSRSGCWQARRRPLSRGTAPSHLSGCIGIFEL
jgi:hypothetical protein